jgi:CBS domain containing-hemolysin-like protein
MAVVLDEQGGLVGIVTLQDILDQLFVTRVEEIEQRADHPQPERIADGLYRIPARLEVTDWNRTLEPQIPEGDSYNTVAGYIFHLFGRLPAKGETIRDAGWSYRVSSIEGTRLTWITARRRERLP